MKYDNFFLILAPVLLLYACGSNDAQEAELIKDEPVPVKIMPITQTSFSSDFNTAGYFTTDDETPLSFKNGGVITRIYVHEGDAIRAGQLLAVTNTTEIQAAAQQAAAAWEKAERDYRRASHLYRDSVATLEQMQNAKTAMEVAGQQKKSIDYNMAQSQIRALKDGFVLKRYLQEGQVAAPGMPVFLVNGTRKDGWIFKTPVTDRQWSSIRLGDSAIVTTDAAPGRSLHARVSKTSEGVDPQTGSFVVQLKIINTGNISLASGLFGKAIIYPSQKTRGWSIPYDALLDGDEDSGFVFVTNDQKTAQRVKVTIKNIAHDRIAIADGLENSQYLIIAGSAYLKNNSAIRVTE